MGACNAKDKQYQGNMRSRNKTDSNNNSNFHMPDNNNSDEDDYNPSHNPSYFQNKNNNSYITKSPESQQQQLSGQKFGNSTRNRKQSEKQMLYQSQKSQGKMAIHEIQEEMSQEDQINSGSNLNDDYGDISNRNRNKSIKKSHKKSMNMENINGGIGDQSQQNTLKNDQIKVGSQDSNLSSNGSSGTIDNNVQGQQKKQKNNQKQNMNNQQNNNDGLKDVSLEIKKNVKQYYTFLGVIGEGGNSQIVKALEKKTANTVAIKIVKKQYIQQYIYRKQSSSSQKKQYQKYLQEAEMVAKFQHPNINKLKAVYEDHYKFYFVSEICSGGNLFDKIIQKNYVSEQIVSKIMLQIMSVLYYCHKNNVVHMDLKPQNILYENKESDNIIITDFGVSQKFFPRRESQMQSNLQILYFQAPEILKKKQYTEACDIYSVGVIFHMLLVGFPPYQGRSEQEILQSQRFPLQFNGVQYGQISKESKVLLQRMLDLNPQNRPSALQVLNDDWMQKQQQILEKTQHLQKNIKTWEQQQHNLLQESQKQKIQMTSNSSSQNEMDQDQQAEYLQRNQQQQHILQVNLLQINKSQKLLMQQKQQQNLQDCIRNLQRFKNKSLIEEQLFLYLNTFMQVLAEKDQILEIFEELDSNQDGMLTYEEVYQGYIQFMSPEQAKKEAYKTFKRVNMKTNQGINYSEFIQATQGRRIQSSQEKVDEAFNNIDIEGSLSLKEVQLLFGRASEKISQKQWESFLQEIDQEYGGRISYVEFKNLMQVFIEKNYQENITYSIDKSLQKMNRNMSMDHLFRNKNNSIGNNNRK